MEWTQEAVSRLCQALCHPVRPVSEPVPAAPVVGKIRRVPNESEAMHQMKIIQREFKQFQKACQELGVYPFLHSTFQVFAEQASDMALLIQGDLQKYKTNSNTVFKVEALEKVRARILRAAEEKRGPDSGKE